jgi:cytochrome P450
MFMFKTDQQIAEQALTAIPGDLGLPMWGSTSQMMADPISFMRAGVAKHGHVFKVRTILDTYVQLLGPDALEFVLYREKERFSSELGWEPNIGRLFPGAVMMMDPPVHRLHRKLMGAAFTRPALSGYVPIMTSEIATAAAAWRARGSVNMFEEIKRLFLTISIRVFFGLKLGSEIDWLDREMRKITAAVVFPFKYAIPFTQMWYALRARTQVAAFIQRAIAGKRKAPDASMLSHFCNATADDEYTYTDEDIVNHMMFMIMASHDTTSSAAASLLLLLSSDPVWMGNVVAEIKASSADNPFAYTELKTLDAAFKETMRLFPSVPAIPRTATEDIAYGDHIIPKGARVAVYPYFNHRDERYWPNPDAFDPGRFLRKEETGHKYQYTPFGTGPHTCLGLIFAELVVKTFVVTLLRDTTPTVTPPWTPAESGIFPFPHPRRARQLRLAP